LIARTAGKSVMTHTPSQCLSLTAVRSVGLALLSATSGAQVRLYRFSPPPTSWEYLGRSVAAAGDVDADGYPDLVVGAPGLNLSIPGRCGIFSGRDGSLLLSRVGGALDTLGIAVAGIGDVNGDGHADILVGASGPTGGYALVLSGRDGTVLYAPVAPQSAGSFGCSVASVGDTDGDGVQDFVIGASLAAGEAYLFSGRTGALRHRFPGVLTTSFFGATVASVGDVNNDAVPDVAVGASQLGLPVSGRVGYVQVYSGLSGSLLHTLPGMGGPGDSFGVSICGAGDVDRDGYADIAVGASQCEGVSPCGAGYVQVLSGFDGHVIRTLVGRSLYDRFGRSLAKLPDADGDGVPELAVGAPGRGSGSVEFFSGASGVWLGELSLRTLPDRFGWVIAALGDVNGDGLGELAIGTDSAGLGSAHVYSLGGDAVRLGRGCGAGGTAPLLDGSTVRTGAAWGVGGLHVQGGVAGLLLLSAAPDVPVVLGGACTAYLDLARVLVLASVRSDGQGAWSAWTNIPSDPSLVGASLATQAVFAPTGGPLAVDLTNGLYCRVRR
jgi:hypothetical protein